MDIFRQHEVFQIEVLDKMNSAKLLEPLVFGGGTMLRLCHELNRYSVDLDFDFAGFYLVVYPCRLVLCFHSFDFGLFDLALPVAGPDLAVVLAAVFRRRFAIELD